MLPGFQITCANKNQNGTIVRVGGTDWSLSTHEAIRRLLSNRLQLYIRVGNESHPVVVRGEDRDAYLALESDGTPLHDIDGLLSC